MSVREGIQASAVEIVSTSTRTEESESQTYTVRLQPRLHVTFDESVIDNEHLGRKKSNKCCIFHKKRAFGESSSESGEDSDDEALRKHKERLCRKHGCHQHK